MLLVKPLQESKNRFPFFALSHFFSHSHFLRRYVVPPQQVRPLPDSDVAAVKLHEFPVNHVVLALFPATTCLYRAIVVGAPSKRKKTFDYLVHFDNDEMDGVVPSRIVSARFVLDFVMEPVNL